MVKCVDAYPARCAKLVALVGGYSPMTMRFYLLRNPPWLYRVWAGTTKLCLHLRREASADG